MCLIPRLAVMVVTSVVTVSDLCPSVVGISKSGLAQYCASTQTNRVDGTPHPFVAKFMTAEGRRYTDTVWYALRI